MTTPANKFNRQVEQMDRRLAEMSRQLAGTDLAPAAREMLEHSFQELTTAMEELYVAQEELRVQNEELMATRMDLEAERQRYVELFEYAPDGYLVTDVNGTIREANVQAAAMLKYTSANLRGKPLVARIAPEDRRALLDELVALSRGVGKQRMSWRIQPRGRPPIDADFSASPVRDSAGKVVSIRWLIRDMTATKRAQQQLLDLQARLRTLATELTRTEEHERRRIAVEIHDRISQTLAMARIKLASLVPNAPKEKKAGFDEVLNLLEQSLQDTRTLTFELSPPVLYELGLIAALQWLAEQVQKRDRIKVIIDGADPGELLPEDTRALLFRAVRELLVNVSKHARATAARVSVRVAGPVVRLTVADDGRGFPLERLSTHSESGGYGLFSIRTRIEEIGGKFEISSVPDTGTRVTLSAPVNTSSRAGGNGNGDTDSASR